MEQVDLGPEFEDHMVTSINKLTVPKSEWPTFKDALRHQIARQKVCPGTWASTESQPLRNPTPLTKPISGTSDQVPREGIRDTCSLQSSWPGLDGLDGEFSEVHTLPAGRSRSAE